MISDADWAASLQGCWQADYQWVFTAQHKGSGIASLIAVVSGQFAVLIGQSPPTWPMCWLSRLQAFPNSQSPCTSYWLVFTMYRLWTQMVLVQLWESELRSKSQTREKHLLDLHKLSKSDQLDYRLQLFHHNFYDIVHVHAGCTLLAATLNSFL